MRSVLVLCALLSAGCDAFREELPGLFVAASYQPVVADAAPASRLSLSRLARELENRFKPPAMPELSKDDDCARASLDTNDDERHLMLAFVDSRTLTKNLISRRVSERLESGERDLLATVLDEQSNSAGARRDVPRSATSLTLEDLQRIERHRYLGVFYVTDYQSPSLILRVGKIRREWYPGQLSARFVLFDTERQRAICGTSLKVTNDVTDAPIRARLQAETRARLERALGDALRVAAQSSLASVAAHLEWPDSGSSRGSSATQATQDRSTSASVW